jgi:hypothetical protein
VPPSEEVFVISFHYGIFFVIAIELSGSYCVCYLCASHQTKEKGADPLRGQRTGTTIRDGGRGTLIGQC